MSHKATLKTPFASLMDATSVERLCKWLLTIALLVDVIVTAATATVAITTVATARAPLAAIMTAVTTAAMTVVMTAATIVVNTVMTAVTIAAETIGVTTARSLARSVVGRRAVMMTANPKMTEVIVTIAEATVIVATKRFFLYARSYHSYRDFVLSL